MPSKFVCPLPWVGVFAAPVLILIVFVNRFGVNVPVFDQWSLIGLFDSIQSGQVDLVDFWSQHNEHRIFFPKLILAPIAFLSNWSNRVEMFVSIMLAGVTLCLIFLIILKGQFESKLIRLNLLISGCLFLSLNQWENWLWGFQVAWFFINLCMLLAVSSFALIKDRLFYEKAVLAGLACFFASFSSAHGLLTWLAIVPLVIAESPLSKKTVIRVSVWLACFGIVVWIYTLGYVSPPYHPNHLFFLQNPSVAIKYLFTITGNALTLGALLTSRIGVFLLINFLLFNFYALWNLGSARFKAIAPWLSLGWYSVLFALMTTVGRAGFGIHQARSSRYITMTILLVIALLQMWQIILSSLPRRSVTIVVNAVILGLVASALLHTNSRALDRAQDEYFQRLRARECLELINFLDVSSGTDAEQCVVTSLFPDINYFKELYPKLEALGFRQFPQPGSIEFKSAADGSLGQVNSPSNADPIVILADQQYLTIQGWAKPRTQLDRANTVLLSVDESKRFIAIDVTKFLGSDVSESASPYERTAWQITVPVESLPTGESTLKVWLYDRDNAVFWQLPRNLQVQKA